MNSKFSFILYLLAALLINFPVFAEEVPVNPDYPYWLEEVTVSAEPLSAGIGAFIDFDSTEIADKAGNSLADILTFTPGGIIKIGSRNEAEFSVRGAIGRDTQLFIDGRPSASPWNGYTDFSTLSLSGISGIMIIKGPPPLKYGSNLGGAVNIVTYNPESTPAANIDLDYGAGDDFHAGISKSGQSGVFSYRLAGVFDERNGYPLSDNFSSTNLEDGGLRENSDFTRNSLSGKIYFPAFDGQTSLSLNYSGNEGGIPPSSEEFPRWWKFKFRNRYSADLKYRTDTRFGKYTSTLYYDNYGDRLKRYSDSSFDEDDYMYDSIHESSVTGLDGGLRTNYGMGIKGELGYRLHFDSFSRKEQTPSSGGFSDPDNHEAGQLELYADGTKKISAISEISFGSAFLNRSENWDLDNFQIAPRLGLVISPLNKIRISFNASRSIQFPTFQHLYDTNSGNPDLKPEKALRFEAGAQYFFSSKTSIAVWEYQSFIDGRIDRADNSSPYLNITESRLWGEEILLKHTRGNTVVSIGIIHQNVQIEEIPGSVFQPLGNDLPEWKIDGWYSAKISDKVDLSASLDYVSSREDFNGNTIGEHYLLDIYTSYRLSDFWSIRGSVKNIFDQDYSLEYGFPMPGRIWKIGMSFRMSRENQD